PVNQDGQFDLKDLEERITADLANNLGNLLSRTITLAHQNGLHTIAAFDEWQGHDALLKDAMQEAYRLYADEMEKCAFHVALAAAWKFIADINAYFQAQQPWLLAKKDPERFKRVISATCHSLYASAVMAWPVMPKKMETLLEYLGHAIKRDG